MPRASKSLTAAILKATTSLRGDEPPTAFRGLNYVLRGGDSPYFEVFGGNKDLSENYNLTSNVITGVLNYTAGSAQIGGYGTRFLRDLRPGQQILVGAEVLGVREVRTDTLFIADRAPLANSKTKSFVDGDVNTGTEVITFGAAHGFVSGQAIAFANVGGTLPAGLAAAIVRYAIAASSTTLKASDTYAHATGGTGVINITAAAGGGTHYAGDAPMRLPQMFRLLTKRGVMMTGNAVEFENGHIIAAGTGELFINGAALPGATLVATPEPQVAIYSPGSGNYTIRPLGYATAPAACVVNVVAGGTKAMPDGDYHSFMIAWWSGDPEGTDGFSNFCAPIKLDGAAAAIKISGANNRFELDFSAALGGTVPTNAKGFIIASNLGGKKQLSVSGATTTTTSPNQTLYENGPWIVVKKVLTSALTANKTNVEFLDSDPDLGPEVTGNNDKPGPADFVTIIDGRPVYLSCFGTPSTTHPEGEAPGKSALMAKRGNPDAAPAEWSCPVDNVIVGFIEAVGRWFMMTPTSLPFIFPTGLLGQSTGATDDLELPLASRPYWRTGAANRYSMIITDDDLIGFSGNKIFTSVGNGDENVKKYDLGTAVEDITRKWFPVHVLVGEDPKNNQVLFFFAASHKNTQGYWCSTILPYSKARQAWLPQLVLSSTTRDMIVSGLVTLDQRLDFLAGGRKSDGSFQTSTYRFDGFEEGETTTVTSMPYYLVWQPSDDGQEALSKFIDRIRPQGIFHSMKVQIHGATPGGSISIADMEAGTNALLEISFANSDTIKRYLPKKTRCRNLANYALRIAGEWNGSTPKDRLDELVVDIGTHGRRR